MPDMADHGVQEARGLRPLPRSHGLISVEEYLNSSYSPDREYRDGCVVERNVGDKDRSRLQARLAHYLGKRRKAWNIEVYTELRVQVRPGWFPIPDVCVYTLPDFEGSYPSRPPELWIEILSPSDTVQDVWRKIQDLLRDGVPTVWIIDPVALTSELHTAAGVSRVSEVLSIPGTPIEIVLSDVMTE